MITYEVDLYAKNREALAQVSRLDRFFGFISSRDISLDSPVLGKCFRGLVFSQEAVYIEELQRVIPDVVIGDFTEFPQESLDSVVS